MTDLMTEPTRSTAPAAQPRILVAGDRWSRASSTVSARSICECSSGSRWPCWASPWPPPSFRRDGPPDDGAQAGM